jgi:hypothetical protein
MSKYKYIELSDKEWLIQKYVIEKLSTTTIANELGTAASVVRSSLKKHEIKLRNLSESQRLNEDNFIVNESVINGSLLGDGQIRCYNKHSKISCPVFKKKNKHYDHVEYVAKLLFDNKNRIFEVQNKYNKKYLTYFEIRSYANEKLIPFFKKWYPIENDYIKLVPKDIVLDDICLLHWFLDDGYSLYIKGAKKRNVFVVFCSESFSEDDQQMLCDQMKNKFNLNAKLLSVKGRGTGYRIKIPTTDVNLFFDLIGKCPVSSMSYKWKISKFGS